MVKRVAILIDGDNVSHKHAHPIAGLGRQEGAVHVHRAYADATNGTGWSDVPGVNLIHAGSGKNAADILLSIDAVEMALSGAFDTFVLASSDRDFTHIATRLRERGFTVVGVGEEKAHSAFCAACTRFETLTAGRPARGAPPACPVTALDRNIRTVIAENSRQGMGMRIAELNGRMRARFDIKISTRPEGNWRTYLSSRPDLFEVDPKGPDAHVRFKPTGFTG